MLFKLKDNNRGYSLIISLVRKKKGMKNKKNQEQFEGNWKIYS